MPAPTPILRTSASTDLPWPPRGPVGTPQGGLIHLGEDTGAADPLDPTNLAVARNSGVPKTQRLV